MVIPELIWGRCTNMIFIKFSENVYTGISFEKMRNKQRVTMLVRSGRPKCKLPSQLRKIVKATMWYGVRAMNLSARSITLGNIINTLEMILNHQRAKNLYDNAFKVGSPDFSFKLHCKTKAAITIEKIVNTTRLYVQGKKCLTLSLY